MKQLAVNGGTPVRTKAFPAWPQYGKREAAALEGVLKSGVWGTLGGEVEQFVEKFSRYQGVDYGVAVTNGTASLEVILRALKIGVGDEVLLPPYTFVATALAIVFQGATPVFVDIDGDTFTIDPEKLEAAITPKTRAIIPVHIGGRPCDMDCIMEIAEKHHLYVIEDAAHAHGSEWRGKRVGSIGHAGSFSFQASKNLTAGEGGFITTREQEIYEACWSVHHCGRDRTGGAWYGHPYIGTNARMTEWQAAILQVQLEKLDAQIEKRMENAAYLNTLLKEIPCIEPLKTDNRITRNSYHLFVLKYKSEACKNQKRETFLKALCAEGVPGSSGYVCLYKQPFFASADFKRITGARINYKTLYLENAETVGEHEGVWLPQNVLLAEKKDMEQIAEAFLKVYQNADEL